MSAYKVGYKTLDGTRHVSESYDTVQEANEGMETLLAATTDRSNIFEFFHATQLSDEAPFFINATIDP